MGVLRVSISSRPRGRRPDRPTGLRRGHHLALVLPTLVLASTVLAAPALADGEGPTPGSDGGTPAVAESSPAPDTGPAPDPKPDPKPAAQPDPQPAPQPDPAPVEEQAAPQQGAAPAADPAPGSAGKSAPAVKDGGKSTSGSAPTALAAAAGNEKVVVCKYVGTPGGVLDHIIIVSVNAIKDFPTPVTFPWTFADAHDSVAIRFALDGEQAKDVPIAACPVTAAPTEIPAPTVPVDDPCGVGNAVYGAVPAGPYAVVRNPDGSITLTADTGFLFTGGVPTYTYPVPVETNTTPCVPPPANDKKVVVCKYVSTPGGVLDHIIIVSVNTLKDFPDPAVFPWQFPDAQDSVAIRFALDGEQAKDVPLTACPQNVPAEITPPVLTVVDPCGVGNAVYGAVPPSADYTVVRNPDGSITLTAVAPATFPGGAPAYLYLPPVETNTAACPPGPAEITPPVVDLLDPCGTGNAAYGPVPASPDYTTVLNGDGSITLTAVAPATFPGGAPTHTFPVPVETVTAPCPVDPRVVVCSYPIARALAVVGTVSIVDLAEVVAAGFTGSFPYDYTSGGLAVEVVRYAADGETAASIGDTITCGISDVVVPDPPDDVPDVPGEVDTVHTVGLPDTGGPAPWLLPGGVALVLAGATLLLGRRETTH